MPNIPNTSVPAITFGPNGFIIPAPSDVLTGCLADWNIAFGGGMNPALNTPQGQCASSEAAIVDNANQTFLYFTTQVDPAFATGRMQDAIARIYFLERDPALPTVVQCTCSGQAGTPIPTGTIAQDTSGNLYVCTTGGTISPGGTVSLSFSNTLPGPTACAAGTLTKIYQAIPGWDSITNPTDGVLGQNVETAAAFEARRQASVALNSRNTVQAVQAAVLNVSGVLDAYSYANGSNSPQTVGGKTIAANSLYVAAVGGDDTAVATAIWSKKSPGCSYTAGTDSVTVYDTSSVYSAPYPSYVVQFTRPTALSIYFNVQMATNSLVPSNAATQVQNAIISAMAGGDGGPRARIGSTIFASRFYSTLAALGAWVQIKSILIGSINATDATFTGVVAANVLTASAVTGTIKIGGIVSGTGVAEGTTIVNQLTGSAGAAGTYTVTGAAAVSSTAMKSASAANNTVTVNIDQVPATSVPDIAVTIS